MNWVNVGLMKMHVVESQSRIMMSVGGSVKFSLNKTGRTAIMMSVGVSLKN